MTRKAISLREFVDLPEELQLEVLHKHGAYVGKRRLNGRVVVLYQLHGFYVELFYRQYRKVVDQIISAEHTGILQPYLDQVNIKDLGK